MSTSRDLIKEFSASPVIPVLTIAEISNALPIAKALANGGLQVIEIALRSSCAFDAITLIRRECPQLLVGAATIISIDEMDAALKAGAQFGASPLYDEKLLLHAKKKQFSYLPCVSNLTQMSSAKAIGFSFHKLFPMDGMGDNENGKKMLRGSAAMVNKLGVGFCTSCYETKRSNIRTYLPFSQVAAVVSGWSMPAKLVQSKNWHAISLRAHQDLTLAKSIVARKNCGLFQATKITSTNMKANVVNLLRRI